LKAVFLQFLEVIKRWAREKISRNKKHELRVDEKETAAKY
jgi:hypothetical protein